MMCDIVAGRSPEIVDCFSSRCSNHRCLALSGSRSVGGSETHFPCHFGSLEVLMPSSLGELSLSISITLASLPSHCGGNVMCDHVRSCEANAQPMRDCHQSSSQTLQQTPSSQQSTIDTSGRYWPQRDDQTQQKLQGLIYPQPTAPNANFDRHPLPSTLIST